MQTYAGTGDKPRTLLFQVITGDRAWWNFNMHATRSGPASDSGVTIELFRNGLPLVVASRACRFGDET